MAEVQPEERWRADAEARLASLAKPPGALGTLEDWCVTLCVAQKTLRPRMRSELAEYKATQMCCTTRLQYVRICLQNGSTRLFQNAQ